MGKKYLDFYVTANPNLLQKLSELVENDRSLLVGVYANNELTEESITRKDRAIFTNEEEEETEFDFTGNKELNYSLGALEKMWITKNDDLCLFISAINKENIEEFRSLLYEEVKKVHIERFPYNNFLYELEGE